MKLFDLLDDGIEAIDLAQPLETGMPVSPTHPGFQFALRQRHGDVERPDGMTGSHEMIVLGGHVGTHMDALCHVAVDGRMYGGVAVADALDDGRYRSHGIDQVPPLVRRGVLVDVPAVRGLDRLPPGEPVSVEDLRAVEVLPKRGDVVLVRTGWAQLWGDPPAYLGDERGVPGLDVEAAAWLAELGVAAVGADTIALEHIPPGGGLASLPVHRLLLAENGINLIEVMALETLAARGAGEFLFVGAPLNIRGATGAPIRPLALVEG
ncbi:cyclase family protein [Actinoallomurus rhizosphaericola]|uniref:cyclase family protein n=1 Tax=Actinoallomurus rhizosphaericola TaxID=2952536 RepID=UPI0020930658|nr:cyclase family protein [Actinoallomurus rhizosphaericola]MCO5997346.1 cyclase family protein [Actinoallomurus rhizosphaericola]